MKKLFLTMVALVAMSTASFAQYLSQIDLDGLASALKSSTPSISYSLPSLPSLPSISSYSLPSLSSTSSYSLPSLPSVSYDIPSTVNYNTTRVNGYYRSNGTYVDSYIKTMPNTTNWDNFSTEGNINTFTGSTGYRARDYSLDALNYGSGHTIYTGPRGGQYYYNSNGNKVYVPKR